MRHLLPLAVLMLMVSIGMSLDLRELVANWRRLPVSTWLRLLGITFVVPPVVALLVSRALGLSLPETAGLFMVGVAPGAPLLTRNIAKRGLDRQLAASYQVWGALLTPVMIPLVVVAAGHLYGRDIWVPPAALLQQIAVQQFLPLLAGIALVYLAPAFAKKMQRAFNVLGNAIMTVAIVAALFRVGPALTRANPWLPAAAATLAVGSILAVRLLVAKDRCVEQTLSISNANRHVGLALLLTGQYLHATAALPAVACYAVVAPLVMGIFSRTFHKGDAAPAIT